MSVEMTMLGVGVALVVGAGVRGGMSIATGAASSIKSCVNSTKRIASITKP